jgi:hypothetical protein
MVMGCQISYWHYGLNSKLTASEAYQLKLFCKDLITILTSTMVLAMQNMGSYLYFPRKRNVGKTTSYINKKYLSYEKMAGKTVEEIFWKQVGWCCHF